MSKGPKSEYLWLVVTRDKYRLPIIVAESSVELAKILGTKPDYIKQAVCHAEKYGSNSKYERVKI